MPKKKSDCMWENNNEETEMKKKSRECVWATSLRIVFVTNCNHVTYLFKNYNYCPYCGRKIRIKESKENA